MEVLCSTAVTAAEKEDTKTIDFLANFTTKYCQITHQFGRDLIDFYDAHKDIIDRREVTIPWHIKRILLLFLKNAQENGVHYQQMGTTISMKAAAPLNKLASEMNGKVMSGILKRQNVAVDSHMELVSRAERSIKKLDAALELHRSLMMKAEEKIESYKNDHGRSYQDKVKHVEEVGKVLTENESALFLRKDKYSRRTNDEVLARGKLKTIVKSCINEMYAEKEEQMDIIKTSLDKMLLCADRFQTKSKFDHDYLDNAVTIVDKIHPKKIAINWVDKMVIDLKLPETREDEQDLVNMYDELMSRPPMDAHAIVANMQDDDTVYKVPTKPRKGKVEKRLNKTVGISFNVMDTTTRVEKFVPGESGDSPRVSTVPASASSGSEETSPRSPRSRGAVPAKKKRYAKGFRKAIGQALGFKSKASGDA